MEMAELENYINKRIALCKCHKDFACCLKELELLKEKMQTSWTTAQERTITMDIKANGITLPCWLAHEIRERLDRQDVKGQRSYSLEG